MDYLADRSGCATKRRSFCFFRESLVKKRYCGLKARAVEPTQSGCHPYQKPSRYLPGILF